MAVNSCSAAANVTAHGNLIISLHGELAATIRLLGLLAGCASASQVTSVEANNRNSEEGCDRQEESC